MEKQTIVGLGMCIHQIYHKELDLEKAIKLYKAKAKRHAEEAVMILNAKDEDFYVEVSSMDGDKITSTVLLQRGKK